MKGHLVVFVQGSLYEFSYLLQVAGLFVAVGDRICVISAQTGEHYSALGFFKIAKVNASVQYGQLLGIVEVHFDHGLERQLIPLHIHVVNHARAVQPVALVAPQ